MTDISDNERAKFFRDYFETGCLCIMKGEVEVVTSESDQVAFDRYMANCKCSRHPEHSRKKELL